MNTHNRESFADFFDGLNDPRSHINLKHQLVDIVVIAICASIAGADNWTDVAKFGSIKEEFFKEFLELPNGIPSHDTFTDVFAVLNPHEFQDTMVQWLSFVFNLDETKHIAIDGKTARRSGKAKLDNTALHMVSAWSLENGIVLGEVATDEKSNEITAIPALLDILDIKNRVITIDAMGCQKSIAEQIVNEDADYIFGLKGNQKGLYTEAKSFFEKADHEDFTQKYYRTVDTNHGRHEVREHWIIEPPCEGGRKAEWAGFRCYGKVRSERTVDGETTVGYRYYSTSLACDAKAFSRMVRNHWAIENSLHWSLDMAFREDESRIRMGNGQKNMASIRRFALSLLKNESTSKTGIKNKRLMAGWDNKYLLKVLCVSGS